MNRDERSGDRMAGRLGRGVMVLASFGVLSSPCPAAPPIALSSPRGALGSSFSICVPAADAAPLGKVAAAARVRLVPGVTSSCSHSLLPNRAATMRFPQVYSSGQTRTSNSPNCIMDYSLTADGHVRASVTYYIEQRAGSREACLKTLIAHLRPAR